MKTLKFISLLKSERGFQLTELMVGGAILAGVALASAQMFQGQNTAQRSISSEQNLTIIHQGLVKKLNSTGTCNATMQAAGLVGQPLAGNKTFTRIAQCGANCNEGGGDLDHRAADVTVAGVDQDIMRAGDFIDDKEVWRVVSIQHASANTRTTSGAIILKVTYEMDPRLTNGATKRITKDLVVNGRFENGVFQECLSAQESSINNLQNDYCKSLNYGSIDSTGGGSGQMAFWNPETQQCEIGVNKDCSAQGLMVDGIDSTGEVKCRDIITPNGAQALQQHATPKSCTSGQQAVLKVISSTGALEIICQ